MANDKHKFEISDDNEIDDDNDDEDWWLEDWDELEDLMWNTK